MGIETTHLLGVLQHVPPHLTGNSQSTRCLPTAFEYHPHILLPATVSGGQSLCAKHAKEVKHAKTWMLPYIKPVPLRLPHQQPAACPGRRLGWFLDGCCLPKPGMLGCFQWSRAAGTGCWLTGNSPGPTIEAGAVLLWPQQQPLPPLRDCRHPFYRLLLLGFLAVVVVALLLRLRAGGGAGAAGTAAACNNITHDFALENQCTREAGAHILEPLLLPRHEHSSTAASQPSPVSASKRLCSVCVTACLTDCQWLCQKQVVATLAEQTAVLKHYYVHPRDISVDGWQDLIKTHKAHPACLTCRPRRVLAAGGCAAAAAGRAPERCLDTSCALGPCGAAAAAAAAAGRALERCLDTGCAFAP